MIDLPVVYYMEEDPNNEANVQTRKGKFHGWANVIQYPDTPQGTTAIGVTAAIVEDWNTGQVVLRVPDTIQFFRPKKKTENEHK